MIKANQPPATATSRLTKAGSTDIHCITVKQPVGPWPMDKVMKHIGSMTLMSCEMGIEARGDNKDSGMPTEEAAVVEVM